MKLVRNFTMQIRTRIEPVFTRSDIFDPSGKLRIEFENLELEFHGQLEHIDADHGCDQDRWQFYIDVFDAYKSKLTGVIEDIKVLL